MANSGTHPLPPAAQPPTVNILPSRHGPTQGRYTHAAQSLLSTVDFNVHDIRDWAILDSGATSHFLITLAPATNVRPTSKPINAVLPNGKRVQSTHDCDIDIPHLPQQARATYVIPGLATHSLLSVVKLCNAGCEVKFTKIGCIVTYRGRTIVCGHKCTKTGLWMIPLAAQQRLLDDNTSDGTVAVEVNVIYHEIANIIHETGTKEELARYYHQCLGSPPKPTLLKALQNDQLSSIPGLSYELISKHLPPSTATDKGHMRRKRQGVQSTRSNRQDVIEARARVDDMAPTEEICAAHDMFCFAALADAHEGTMYTDLNGSFPVRSFRNMVTIFVAYVYNLNTILVRAMPSKTDDAMIAAFNSILLELEAKDSKPQLNVMDNECSKAVEAYITKNKLDIQLVPPRNHRVNAAERAIATFKEHFIASLATMDFDCPLQLWDEFLDQVSMTLNLLRTSRRNPAISAYEDLFGQFDFNKTPIAPIGTKALIYDDPEVRASWAPHGSDAYVVGPARKHYRCLRFFMPLTR